MDSQTQVPRIDEPGKTQSPWPAHVRPFATAHVTGASHARPPHPGSQKQRPWRQTPCDEQKDAHETSVEQTGPLDTATQKPKPRKQPPPAGGCLRTAAGPAAVGVYVKPAGVDAMR